jgi:hypothetical protein
MLRLPTPNPARADVRLLFLDLPGFDLGESLDRIAGWVDGDPEVARAPC